VTTIGWIDTEWPRSSKSGPTSYVERKRENTAQVQLNLIEISFIRQLFIMCLMEFSRAEHSALFRRNTRNLRYL
jgi:hypothetical protein